VKHLVTSLRASGNAVQGILDRDQRSDAPDGIVFVAARRALENLILDPLAVGLFLLREQIANPKAMGAAGLRHFELQPQHAQGVCDYVVAGVGRPDDEGASVTLSYIGGFSVAAPRFYVDIDGHDLEDRLGSAFPQLKKYGSGLKLSVIQRALADLPDFIPKDVLDLLQRLTT